MNLSFISVKKIRCIVLFLIRFFNPQTDIAFFNSFPIFMTLSNINYYLTIMKRIIFSVLCIFFAGFFTCCGQEQKKNEFADGYLVKVGDTAPDFTINEAGGPSYRLSDLRGKVVMLQFTASWCGVCRTEMPFIENEIWKAKKNEGLAVIGIDRDQPIDTVLKFKKDIKVSYPLALDPGAGIFCLFAQKSAGVTRNVIIDRKGKIIFLTRLYKREEFDEMKKIIFAELQKK
jgi:peroxiredoxin